MRAKTEPVTWDDEDEIARILEGLRAADDDLSDRQDGLGANDEGPDFGAPLPVLPGRGKRSVAGDDEPHALDLAEFGRGPGHAGRPMGGAPDFPAEGGVMSRVRMAPGVGWAYVGVVFGMALSLTGNIAHLGLRSTPATWWDVFMAAAPPLGLFIALEVLARFQWDNTRTSVLIRWAGMLPVVGVAALVSFRAISGLLISRGEDQLMAWLLPAAIDGLMLMCTSALLFARRHSRGRVTAFPVPRLGTATPRREAA